MAVWRERGAEDLEDRPGREDIEDGEDAPESRRGRHAGRIACLTFFTGKSAGVTFVRCRFYPRRSKMATLHCHRGIQMG